MTYDFDLNQFVEGDFGFRFKSILNGFDLSLTVKVVHHFARLFECYLLSCVTCSAIVSSLCDVTDCC